MYTDEWQAKREQEEEMRLRSVAENERTEYATFVLIVLALVAAICFLALQFGGK